MFIHLTKKFSGSKLNLVIHNVKRVSKKTVVLFALLKTQNHFNLVLRIMNSQIAKEVMIYNQLTAQKEDMSKMVLL